MNIPLKIVQAGLLDEFLVINKKISQLKVDNYNNYQTGTAISEKIRDLWIIDNARNYAVRNPTQLKWTEVVAIHDLTKEMIEINGRHQELGKELEEAEAVLESLYHQSNMKWDEYKWV